MATFFFRIEKVIKRDVLLKVTADTEIQARATATVGSMD